MPAGPVLRTSMQYSVAFCNRLEAASDVVSSRIVRPVVPDKAVKFRGPNYVITSAAAK